MKLIIFGTGKYYQEFKKYISPEQIVCFVDNNPNKQCEYLDGKAIKAAQDVDFSACDYVLVMVMRYQDIYRQLRELGVPCEKIKAFFDLGDLFHIEPVVNYRDNKICLKDWVKTHEKKVLLVAHELTRNGVAVVLMNTVDVLCELGYSVVITGLIGGALEDDIQERNIGYISSIGELYCGFEMQKYIQSFDFVIAGAVGTAHFVRCIAETDIPIIWWMHESNDQNFIDFDIPERSNIYYYAGGKRVIDMFKKYYPDRKIEKLLYFLPDKEMLNDKVINSKLRISVIGAVNYRKAQDIFVDAVSRLAETERMSVEFDIVGAITEPVINIEEVKSKLQINYLGELSESKLGEYFETIDILVSCSRDDPMPVVVTQAMQNNILCIVSDQVGQSEYIHSGKDGFVFHSGDSEELANILKYCIENINMVERMGQASYGIFEAYFSQKVMRDNLQEIIRKITTGA